MVFKGGSGNWPLEKTQHMPIVQLRPSGSVHLGVSCGPKGFDGLWFQLRGQTMVESVFSCLFHKVHRET